MSEKDILMIISAVVFVAFLVVATVIWWAGYVISNSIRNLDGGPDNDKQTLLDRYVRNAPTPASSGKEA